MSRHEVKEMLIKSADRFGYNNSQEAIQLKRRFRRFESQEVFEGLICLFKEEQVNLNDRQELAGRLLFNMKPEAKFDLYSEIKECLPYFDLSVEHLPFYFVEQAGFQRVREVVESFLAESLSERERESLSTIEFWLNNYEKWKGQRE